MKKILSILAASATLLLSQSAFAQVYLDDDYDFRGRISVGAEKKIVKGLTFSLDEEIRLKDNFCDFDRFMTTAYLSYKPIKYFKVGFGWTMINATELNDDTVEGNDNKYFWKTRQRLYLDATGLYKVGGWKFSLRERLESTVRADDFNAFQRPRHEIALRSRFKVGYSINHLEPYALVDVKAKLNEVNINSLATTASEVGTMETKYNTARLSRVRGAIGLVYNINKYHSLDFYILEDYNWTRTIDTNEEGKIKKVVVMNDDGVLEKRQAIYYQNALNSSIGVGYKFSF